MQGLKYNEACEKAGYGFKDSEEKLVKKQGKFLEVIKSGMETTIPVVNRTVAQFRKVYNAMIRKFREPDQVNLEMGRELKKSFEERKKIQKIQKENEDERQEALKEIENQGISPNSSNILKLRLYNQQDGKCLYSGEIIDIKRLDEEGYVDVDHVIPYSRSLDNSQNNKILCLSSENRMKSSKTPYEYLNSKEKWH